MSRRKKRPRLPNGFGSIRYIGGGRRNPYSVHPPTTDFSLDGSPKRPPAICYVDDWMVGFAVLTAVKAGTYKPGMEADFKNLLGADDNEQDLDILAKKILSDYGRYRRINVFNEGLTFSQVYTEFYDNKYNGRKIYSESAKKATRTAYGHCKDLWERTFSQLRYTDLQKNLNACPLKHSSLEHIISLYRQMYTYAKKHEIVDTDYSVDVEIEIPDDDEHGEPFTKKDLQYFWKHQQNETIEFLLIMCYSGFRISEYENVEVNIEGGYFQGGIKTDAGKSRVVPIHSAILPLVRRRMARDGHILNCPTSRLRKRMYTVLERAGIEKHTPHDCRHTFSELCERYEVRENDRKRMLGHVFKDVTNKVYGHRTVEDLQKEIEKIKVPYLFCTRSSGARFLVSRKMVSFSFKSHK